MFWSLESWNLWKLIWHKQGRPHKPNCWHISCAVKKKFKFHNQICRKREVDKLNFKNRGFFVLISFFVFLDWRKSLDILSISLLK